MPWHYLQCKYSAITNVLFKYVFRILSVTHPESIAVSLAIILCSESLLTVLINQPITNINVH
jgi:hypothetical protein